MTVKTILTALVLGVAPGLAMAEGCGFGHEAMTTTDQVTMSCAQGTAWDADAQSCVPVVSS